MNARAPRSSTAPVMILILIIGILVDSVFFGTLERKIRKRYGLVDAAAK